MERRTHHNGQIGRTGQIVLLLVGAAGSPGEGNASVENAEETMFKSVTVTLSCPHVGMAINVTVVEGGYQLSPAVIQRTTIAMMVAFL